MYYRLRRRDGSADPHSAGSLVEADGSYRRIGPEDIAMRPLRWWSQGERRYPIDWSLEINPWGQMLEVRALVDDQLMDLSVRYWEGAVEVRDPAGAVLGFGYLELAGY
jgi:predicted secreted hydrolase